VSEPSNKINLEDIVLGKIYRWQCFVCDLREAYGERGGRRFVPTKTEMIGRIQDAVDAAGNDGCIHERRVEGTLHCGDYFVAVALVPGDTLYPGFSPGFLKIITMTKKAFTTCVEISGVRAVNTENIAP
jgi:hypothetical protein